MYRLRIQRFALTREASQYAVSTSVNELTIDLTAVFVENLACGRNRFHRRH